VPLFEDTFDRPDSTTIGGNWVETYDDWGIVSNGVRPIGSLDGAFLSNTTDVGTGNYAVSADIDLTSFVYPSAVTAIARYQNDLGSWYDAFLGCVDSTHAQVVIRRWSSGVQTNLMAPITIPMPTSPVTLSLKCSGSVLEVVLAGESLAVVSDSTYATGSFGVGMDYPTHSTSVLFRSVTLDAVPPHVFSGVGNQWLHIYGPGGANPGDLGVSAAPFTFIVLIRSLASGSFNGIFQNGEGSGGGGGTGFWCGYDASGHAVYFNVGSGFVEYGSGMEPPFGQWALIAFVFRTGGLQSSYSYYFSTHTWHHVHDSHSFTLAAPTKASVGNYLDSSGNDAFSEYLNADIAWLGLWSSDLSDGASDTPASIQTFIDNGPWSRKADSDCTFFLAFDQDVATIPDEAGT